MDKKKTYYNSILEHVQPRFKFKQRKRKNQLDEEGYSVRDDLSSVEFSYGSRAASGDRWSSAKGKPGQNLFRRAGKNLTPGTAVDEKQKVKLLVDEFFKEKEGKDNNYNYSTTGDDYYYTNPGVPSTFFNMKPRNRNKYSDESDDDDSNSDMY